MLAGWGFLLVGVHRTSIVYVDFCKLRLIPYVSYVK